MYFSYFPHKHSSFQTQEASDFSLSYGFALFSTLYFISLSVDIILFHFVFFNTPSAECNPKYSANKAQ